MAFARAFDEGADGIEFDVRLSRDGVPVVIHDASLRRTGCGNGVVARMTTDELARVDVGSWFNRAHPKLARDEYSLERVPALAKVFEQWRERRGILYVELKSDRGGSSKNLVTAVGEEIKRFDFAARTVVVSFDHQALAYVKSFDPSIRTGALFEARRGPTGWRSQTIVSAAVDCGADEILLHRLLARRRSIEKCRDRNLPVVVWTVDDPKWVPRARAVGIHALITNNPAKLLAAA